MLARKPRPRRASPVAALRGGSGPNLEALAARWSINEGMAIARLAYDDDDSGVRSSALDEENHGGVRDSNIDFRRSLPCVFMVLCVYAGN
jgi:hypothetical protein